MIHPCLFAVELQVVLIYVNDIIITGDNDYEFNILKHSLQHKFAIKDLGVLKYFLGIQIETSTKGLFLNQRKHVMDLLKEANICDAKPAIATSLEANLHLAWKASHCQRLAIIRG